MHPLDFTSPVLPGRKENNGPQSQAGNNLDAPLHFPSPRILRAKELFLAIRCGSVHWQGQLSEEGRKRWDCHRFKVSLNYIAASRQPELCSKNLSQNNKTRGGRDATVKSIGHSLLGLLQNLNLAPLLQFTTVCNFSSRDSDGLLLASLGTKHKRGAQTFMKAKQSCL